MALTIVLLVDFLPTFNQLSSSSLFDTSFEQIITNFQLKLREKLVKPFSNNFNLISTIDCRQFFDRVFEPVYDVQLSKYCSCLVALSRYSFLIIDQVTNFKSYIINHDKRVSYFTIEENYNGRGFDALLCNDSGNVVKFDLREFIETKGKCKPLWKVKGSDWDRGINIMILEGKRTVVVDNGYSLVFYDATDGTCLSKYNTETVLENLNSSVGVDHMVENTFYAMIGRNIERFEYIDNAWKISLFKENISCLVDVFVVDKISGLVYYFMAPAFGVFKAIVLNRDGEMVLEKKLASGSSGFCIDNCSGKMFVCHDSSILVYE